MHSAPSVTYPVVRSRRAALLLAAAWALGAVPVACWAAGAPAVGAVELAASAWILVSGVLAAMSWRHAPRATLAWDGQHWRCDTPGLPPAEGLWEGDAIPTLDLQSLLLVRFQPVRGGTRWLWLDRSAAPAAWHGLRCALAARPRPVPLEPAPVPEAAAR
ncbi:MAG: hypothetical protein V4505_20260 [Pseudomonadota bacterium]